MDEHRPDADTLRGDRDTAQSVGKQLGTNLPATFRTIESFANGIATSIKSIDLNAATYQDAARLTCRLNDYIDKMVLYEGGDMGDITIKSSEISGRVLSLAIPKGNMTAAQQAAIEAARARAQASGVYLNITPFWAMIMYSHYYLRNGVVYVPTMGKMEKGFYRGIEPVAVVSVMNTETLHEALAATIARGNPDVPKLLRREWPPPVVLKYAGVKRWSTFERGMFLWNLEEQDGIFQIAGNTKRPNGMWLGDPEHIIAFPPGTSVDEVINRAVSILQHTARQ